MRVSLWRGLIPVVALLLAVPAARAQTNQTASAYAERGQFADGLFSRGMYKLALREYTALLKQFPAGDHNDRFEYRRGESHRLLGELPVAATSFDRLFANYPKSAYRLRAAYRRARLYMDEGDRAAAAEHFKAILALNPDPQISVASMYYLGEALLATDRPGEAAAAFALIEKRHPESAFAPFALMKRAEILRRDWESEAVGTPRPPLSREDKHIVDILAIYTSVLARPGSDRTAAEALFQTAELHFRLKDYTRSAEFYRRLLRDYAVDQRAGEARLQAAWAASYAGLYADALTLAETALAEKEMARPAEWLYLKANCERQLGRLDGAVASYSQLLERHPKTTFSEAARYELALAYYKLGRHAEAVAAAERIELTSSMKLEVSRLLAECYAALEQPAKSIQYYRLIEKDAPAGDLQRDATYRLGYHLQALGNYRDAAQFYTKLVERYPQHKLAPQALFAAGVCYLKAGDQTAASRDLGRLILEYPASPMLEEALYQKALTDLRLEHRPDASSGLAELLRRFPKGRYLSDAHYWLGTVQQADEALEDATASFRRATKLATRPEMKRQAEYSLALALQQLGKDAEAADVFGRVLATPLASEIAPTVLEWLAGYYYQTDRQQKAIAAATRLTLNEESAAWQQVGYALIGRSQLAHKQVAEARAAFVKALAQPSATRYGAEAALRLGDLALAENDSAVASDYYNQASARAASPSTLGIRARAFFGLGAAASKAEQYDDAARFFMSVAILYDDPALVPEALWLAGTSFDKIGSREDAIAAYEELVVRHPDTEWGGRAQELLTQWRAEAASSEISPAEVPEARAE